MKKLLFAAALVSLFMFGCSQDIGVNQPVQSKSTHEIIKLPAFSSLSSEAVVSVSESIDGSVGGAVYLNQTVPGGPFGQVVFNGELDVPQGAYTGTQNIAITFDDETTAATYTPSPFYFDQPVTLTLELKGLDLTGVDPSTVQFVYIDPAGQIDHVQYSDIQVDIATGTLKVIGAELHHFSRYGFID
jgi:hypothetical protein